MIPVKIKIKYGQETGKEIYSIIGQDHDTFDPDRVKQYHDDDFVQWLIKKIEKE